MSLQNPNGHRLALFFASGASCTAGLDSPDFASRPAFDQPDTLQNALAVSGVPCDQPPCCFIVQCSATNSELPDGNACKGLSFGAAFRVTGGGGGAAAAAGGAASLSIPAIAGISVSGLLLVVGIALGVYAVRAGWGACCGQQPRKGDGSVPPPGASAAVLNPAAAASLYGAPGAHAAGQPPAVAAWGERPGGQA
jgi:hypothetical protein